MDILLTHAYFIAEDEHEQAIMKPYPPLGLLYISSHLKAKGFDVELYDSTFSSMAKFAEYARAQRPGLVGIYCNLMTKHNALRMISVLKEIGATIILGGPEPTSYASDYLRTGADIVVIGEGEHTVEELIPLLASRDHEGLSGVSGIVFRDETGTIVRTPPRALIKDLSAQPWPDREAIDMQQYMDTWRIHHGMSAVSMITARGCPYTCTWCSHSVFGHTHRRRTVVDVADEIAWIKERYDPDQLWYADDVLTIAPRWFLNYADELKRRGIRIPFECISRPDRLDETIITALSEMGCYRLWLGSESGSQRILDAMKRKTRVEDVQAKSKLLQAAGIEVGMFIMLGYQGETVSDIVATTEHLKRAGPDTFLTTVAYPIKGTAYYEEVADRIATNGPWEERTDRDLGVTGRYSTRFYDHATRWMVSEVNLHKAWREGNRNPWHLGRMFLSAQRGRLGMRLTSHEREGVSSASEGGRGWSEAERAGDGW